MAASEPQKRTLARCLTGVFLFALVMGPGPGIYLINPDPGDAEASTSVFGMPIVYVWAVFWAMVMGLAVVVAYAFLWPVDENEA